MLWDKDTGPHTHHSTADNLEALFGTNLSALQSVMPQLVFYQGPAQASIQAFLLRTCESSGRFAHEVYWLMLAHPKCHIAAETIQDAAVVPAVVQTNTSITDARDPLTTQSTRNDPQTLPEFMKSIAATMIEQERNGGECGRFSQALRVVNMLTQVSEDLLVLPPAERSERLRRDLSEINRLLSVHAAFHQDTCSSYLPLSEITKPPLKIIRFLEDEALILVTNERVPFVCFVEVIDSSLTTEDSRRSLLRTFSSLQSVSIAAGRLASRHAGILSRPQRFLFGRRALARRSRSHHLARDRGADGHLASTASPCTRTSGLVHSSSCSSPQLPSTLLRSNSDPEIANEHLSFTEVSSSTRSDLLPTSRTEDMHAYPPSDGDPAQRSPRASPSVVARSPVHAGYQHIGSPGTDSEAARSAHEENAFPVDDASCRCTDYGAGFGELWAERVFRLRKASPSSSLPGWTVKAFIVKSNDDLLQEQFAMTLIREFDRIFNFARLPLRLRPYRILATSPRSGLIEVVPDAKSLDAIKRIEGASYISLSALFKRRHGSATSVGFQRARRNFVQSLAAYSVISYLLQLKDRHNGNILLHADGSIVHIDFGFLLSNSPGKNMGFEAAPFKLTSEWVDLMGGVRSACFRYFSTLVIRGLQESRRHMEKLLLLVTAMFKGVHGALPCFRNGEATIEAMRSRFHPDLTEQQFARFAAGLIDGSLDNWRTGAYDCYQRCCLGIL